MNRVPMSAPDITQAEIDAINAVLETPHLSLGPQLEAFERTLAACVGAQHAVGVSSGTQRPPPGGYRGRRW